MGIDELIFESILFMLFVCIAFLFDFVHAVFESKIILEYVLDYLFHKYLSEKYQKQFCFLKIRKHIQIILKMQLIENRNSFVNSVLLIRETKKKKKPNNNQTINYPPLHNHNNQVYNKFSFKYYIYKNQKTNQIWTPKKWIATVQH